MEENKKKVVKYTLMGTNHVFYGRKEAKAVCGNGRFGRLLKEKKFKIEYVDNIGD